MALPSFAPDLPSRQRISLAAIDAAVSARLGTTRGLGNSQPACFNRQVAMYLAKHVGRWTTTIIGRFYNGRDHCGFRGKVNAIPHLTWRMPAASSGLTKPEAAAS